MPRDKIHLRTRFDWEALPQSIREIFLDLAYTPVEYDYCRLPSDMLAVSSGRQAFRDRQHCRRMIIDLAEGNTAAVTEDLDTLYAHLRGGPVERYIYPRAEEITAHPDLNHHIENMSSSLIERGLSGFVRYTRSGAPCDLRDFRPSFAVTKLAQWLAPVRATEAHDSFRSELFPYRNSYPLIPLFLRSLFAWNPPLEPRPADMDYLEFLGHLEHFADWDCCAQHVVAFYSDPRSGWELMQLGRSAAARWRRARREKAAKELIDRIDAMRDQTVNRAWTAARFGKLRVGMEWLDVDYRSLAPRFANKVRRIVHTTRQRTHDWPDRPKDLMKQLSAIEIRLPAVDVHRNK